MRVSASPSANPVTMTGASTGHVRVPMLSSTVGTLTTLATIPTAPGRNTATAAPSTHSLTRDGLQAAQRGDKFSGEQSARCPASRAREVYASTTILTPRAHGATLCLDAVADPLPGDRSAATTFPPRRGRSRFRQYQKRKPDTDHVEGGTSAMLPLTVTMTEASACAALNVGNLTALVTWPRPHASPDPVDGG